MVSEAIFLDNMGRNISGSEAHRGRPGKPGVGCFGGRQLVKNTSIWLSKWGRWALSDRATFSDFVGSDNENGSENHNDSYETDSSEDIDVYSPTFSIHHSQVSLKRMNAS